LSLLGKWHEFVGKLVLDVFIVTEQPNDYTLSTTKNEEREPPEQTTMFLWDVTNTSSFETLVESKEFRDVLVVQTRSKALVVQNQPVISQAPKKYEKPIP
jgi:hypothetical protein